MRTSYLLFVGGERFPYVRSWFFVKIELLVWYMQQKFLASCSRLQVFVVLQLQDNMFQVAGIVGFRSQLGLVLA